MKEVRAAGGKEFVFSMLWAMFLLFVSRGIVNSLPDYKMIGAIAGILMYCVLGYFVLTRYSSRFTYENTGTSLRINRMIGKRNKEIEFKLSDIKNISRVKPKKLPKQVFYMRVSVFSDKRSYYITFTRDGEEYMAVVEATEEFMKKLEKAAKGYKKGKGKNNG
jgi:hypothetical protein